MIIQTKDLTGDALDWAVAYATNGKSCFFEAFGARMLGRIITKEVLNGSIKPSTNWSQCGPLIERYEITIDPSGSGTWSASDELANWIDGPTALIAACRAIVAAELGNSVDVPDELV